MKNFDKSKIFPKNKSVGRRTWGNENLITIVPKKFSLKTLFIKKGRKGGLQYHHKKNESGYLVHGTLIIRYDLGDGKLRQRKLKKGQSFHFPPGLVHQEEAVTDCLIVEASTPHFNDRVRVEEKYNQRANGGLPSTKKNQVKLL